MPDRRYDAAMSREMRSLNGNDPMESDSLPLNRAIEVTAYTADPRVGRRFGPMAAGVWQLLNVPLYADLQEEHIREFIVTDYAEPIRLVFRRGHRTWVRTVDGFNLITLPERFPDEWAWVPVVAYGTLWQLGYREGPPYPAPAVPDNASRRRA